MQRITLLTILLALPGCSDDRPPGPTAEQEDQLNEAEEMLNGFNEEGPMHDGTGPSNSS